MPRRRMFAVALPVVAAIVLVWHRHASIPDDGGVETCDALPVVVHLVGEHHEVTMYDGTSGPMYTVKDTTGGVVAGCVAEDALLRQHPDLVPPTLGVIRTLHSAQVGYLH